MVYFLDTFKVFRRRGLLQESIENGPIKLVGDAGHDAARECEDGEARSEAEGEEHRVPSGRGDEQIRAELEDMEDEEETAEEARE